MATKKNPRTVPFAEIERRFQLMPLRLGLAMHPAVARNHAGGYSIRVLVSASVSGYGRMIERFDYFRLDADGTITEAPRGYAKDYKPGQIPVADLDRAVKQYAEAIGEVVR